MKDDSFALVNDVTIKNCEYGVALYQKKPDFGPAHVVVTSISIEGSDHDYIVEENSSSHNLCWGEVNKKTSEEIFDKLLIKVR